MALGILEQHATETQTPFVKAATEKAAQISALVAELLTFSKADLGASTAPLENVALTDIVAEAVRREATDPTAALDIAVPAHLRVTAAPELLVRALANLLRNALQHGTGPITLRAEARGDTVTLAVADTGPGVPEADLPRLFDAFYRVDPSRTRATGGTGLGLAIVKTCIESCAGTVTARNRAPRGLEILLHLRAAA